MGSERPLLRVEPGALTGVLDRALTLPQPFSLVADLDPGDGGIAGGRESPEAVQAKPESVWKLGLIEFGAQAIEGDGVDLAQEAKREVQVLRWDELSGER